MKLIIDIPDEYFEQIKNNTEGSTAESEAVYAIRNGISYEERPQVPVFAENASEEEIEDFKKELEDVLKRPAGEWIDHSEDYGYVECPVCGNLTTCHDNKDELHYCWYCGSKMGKGAAE